MSSIARAMAIAVVLLAGCTKPSDYRPTVDMAASHKTSAEYEHDVVECQDDARVVDDSYKSMIETTSGGALLGAGAGLIIGGVSGADVGTAVGLGAAAGATAGGIYGATGNYYTAVKKMQDCMKERGYVVLG
jgi:hypothetical protein